MEKRKEKRKVDMAAGREGWRAGEYALSASGGDGERRG